MFDNWRGFKSPELSKEWHDKLTEMAREARGNIIKMTSLAASGHPGGSMSSIDIYLTLYNMARVSPHEPWRDDRDRIIISHGHTSPGAYSALAAAGYFDAETAIAGFRQAGSPFEGHVEQSVPGIEWDTGNLGQGLAVGIGKAIYAQLSGQNFHTFVCMGDGEQQKGQISESRRIAVKYGLKNVTAIIDYNKLQISGNIDDVMPQNIAAEWEADGWNLISIDGHDLNQIYQALHAATQIADRPTVIVATTVMGKGVSFMENKAGFHGAPVKPDDLPRALAELGVVNNMDELIAKRAQGAPPEFNRPDSGKIKVISGTPITYGAEVKTDNRSAFGNALLSVADANLGQKDFSIGVFDCDLAGSVKTAGFASKYP
ncbi:MAG: thiamine pyrophosphate-dependent enzyme [bacterium]|nr:thiamine pyrophosphate-dependent enzyme [bacterium]